MILTPAYGRDYRSKQAVLDDFNADKDFILNDLYDPWDGRPLNRPQIIELKTVTEVTFRYDKLRKVFSVKFPNALFHRLSNP